MKTCYWLCLIKEDECVPPWSNIVRNYPIPLNPSNNATLAKSPLANILLYKPTEENCVTVEQFLTIPRRVGDCASPESLLVV